ncbi:MAG: lysophospholipid acyltransferase family protein [Myxococcota bacterium]|nr:lysophospholipid acyltransferase family protein [Myxococcota bacterium]
MTQALMSICLWACGGLTFGLCAILYLALSLLLGPPRLHAFARLTCRLTLMASGQRLHVIGDFKAAGTGPFIYIFNHTSLLDTFVLIAAIPEFVGAAGKIEQFTMPIWGRVLKRWGVVPIDRAHRHDAIEKLSQALECLRSGRSFLIAPEGTRSGDGRLMPFKKGPFHLAHQSQRPVLPLAIVGAFRAKNTSGWHLRPGTITVHVGTPIPPRHQSVQALANECRGALEDALVRTQDASANVLW